MSENSNVTEISISDIIKMFKGKGRRILCIAIVFAILGGSISLIKTNCFGHYGDTVMLCLNTSADTDGLLPLLESDLFSEKLLLDENGLPAKESCDPQAYDSTLKAIQEYKLGREKVIQAKNDADNYFYNIPLPDGSFTTWSNLSNQYALLQQDCDDAVKLLSIYKSAQTDAVVQDPNHITITAEYERQLEKALNAKQEFEDSVYTEALNIKNGNDERIQKAFYELRALKKTADALTEEILEDWRNSNDIGSKVTSITNSLSFTCSVHKENSEEQTVYVTAEVSVLRNKELAESIVNKLHSVMPAFVQKNVEGFSGVIPTQCHLITPFSNVGNFDSNDAVQNAVRSALLVSVSALALYCCFIIARCYIKRATEK